LFYIDLYLATSLAGIRVGIGTLANRTLNYIYQLIKYKLINFIF
jgi:hypothetical protein